MPASITVILLQIFENEKNLATANNSKNNVEKLPEEYECDGAPRERSTNRKKRSKGRFKKLNSNNRLHGSGYVKFNTCNLVPPKSIGVRCSGNCKKLGKKCDSFSEIDRKKIFDAFYGLSSPQLQREFICRHVDSKPCTENRAGEESRRQETNKYHLTIRKRRTTVCKQFFLRTLAISEKVARTAIKKLDDVGIVELDQRGGRDETNKNRDTVIRQLVDAYINRFPRIESHFCRQNTDSEYLSSDLTLTKMHSMFCNEQNDSRMSVSFTFYSRIFHEKNLSFHHLKKDQCTLCITFRTGDQQTRL